MAAAIAVACVLAARPNIVVFLLDDVGHGDLGITGHSIARTPAIQGFAKTATRLTTMYAGAPICSTSRAALLSGRYSDATGVWELVTPGASEMHLMPDAFILGNLLAQGGYACGQMGKWHVSHVHAEVDLAAYGFESIRPRRRLAVDQANVLVGWLAQQLNASRPFFLYWDPHECHEPVAQKSPEPFRAAYGPPTGLPPVLFSPVCEMQTMLPGEIAIPTCTPLSSSPTRDVGSCEAPSCARCERCSRPAETDAERTRLVRARSESWRHQRTYLGCLTQADTAFGKLLTFLRTAGVEANTLVLLSSDNGPELRLHNPPARRDCFGSAAPFRGLKGSVYEGGIRVPGLVRWRGGGIGRFTRAELREPLHFVDVLPTLAEAAGIQLPQGAAARLHGVSFLRLLRTPASAAPPEMSPSRLFRREPLEAGGVRPTGSQRENSSRALSRPFPLFWSTHLIAGNGRKDGVCARCDIARYAIRVGRWKLLAWTEPYDCRVRPMDYIIRARLLDEQMRLFDLRDDPTESRDLARIQPGRAAQLRQELVRTRAAVQAVGPTWDLSCQLPTGRRGVRVGIKPALTGLCHCKATSASGATIEERAALAASLTLTRAVPRPLLILSPPCAGAELLDAALSAHPQVVSADSEPFRSTRPPASPLGGAAVAQQRAVRSSVELFGGGPLCAFEFAPQLGARANATARALHAVRSIRHVGLLLASRKLDALGREHPLGGALLVSVRASPEELVGAPQASGAACVDAKSARARARDAAAAAAQLSAPAHAGPSPLVAAFGAAGAVAVLLVRRDRLSHWCELTKGARSALRAAQCSARGTADVRARIQGRGALRRVLESRIERSARSRRLSVRAARQRLLSGGSVYRELEAAAAEGDLAMPSEEFDHAAEAEDAATEALLRAAGISVVKVAEEDLRGLLHATVGDARERDGLRPVGAAAEPDRLRAGARAACLALARLQLSNALGVAAEC
ncbi:hypothetical protein KFE25_008150 [Diacronema lutheri]|uniref:Sulfatase N-terminal domain-containing protein n=1 Tax=Diacronema lutheri TaxID=2081491 RepID=A0A8J5XNC7_DIALT|nr:hypothetical protein KFE25_008150 [Diacronema lutheri]